MPFLRYPFRMPWENLFYRGLSIYFSENCIILTQQNWRTEKWLVIFENVGLILQVRDLFVIGNLFRVYPQRRIMFLVCCNGDTNNPPFSFPKCFREL